MDTFGDLCGTIMAQSSVDLRQPGRGSRANRLSLPTLHRDWSSRLLCVKVIGGLEHACVHTLRAEIPAVWRSCHMSTLKDLR